MNKTRKQIGNRLRQLRKRLKLTQEGVAEKAGMNPTYYGRVERGDANISLELLLSVADVLAVTLSELLDIVPQKDKRQMLNELNSILQSASDSDVRLVYRFAKDMLVRDA